MVSTKQLLPVAQQCLGAVAACGSTKPSSCDESCIQNATAFAFMYGYPLYAYGLAVQGSPNATTNSLIHQRDLANANETWVVRPNADTLYSRAFLDLSTSDLVITVPEFGDRYWVWPFYDAYGNNVANFGSIGSYPAGKYLVRYDPEDYGVQSSNISVPYQAYIKLPTPYAISLTRILVESAEDVAEVRTLQDGLSITPVARNETPVAPELDLGIFTNPHYMPGSENSLEEGVLKLTAKLAPWNPAVVQSDRSWIANLLQKAGLANGTFTQQPSTNLTAASASANASATALLAQTGYVHSLGGNWTAKDASIIGEYGSHYEARYQIATVGYLALTPEQAVYPSYRYGKSSSITANQALLLTFSAKPKIKSGGFWSLTAYDGSGYLIPNSLDRYALGDRSNLTLTDGTALRDGDGTFRILVQPSNLSPPDNWTSNWLPAPQNGGVVSLNLRLYGAEDAMTNGAYVYPVVETIDAILA